jgi:hypothetical protein
MPPVTGTRDEQREIEHVATRLAQDFPTVPDASVREAIVRAWSMFEGSKIREFVPVLAERLARAQLRVSTA